MTIFGTEKELETEEVLGLEKKDLFQHIKVMWEILMDLNFTSMAANMQHCIYLIILEFKEKLKVFPI